MLDEILENLCSGIADEEWTSLGKLSKILSGRGLRRQETEGIMRFLTRYFLEVDEIGGKARLSSWAQDFFDISEL